MSKLSRRSLFRWAASGLAAVAAFALRRPATAVSYLGTYHGVPMYEMYEVDEFIDDFAFYKGSQWTPTEIAVLKQRQVVINSVKSSVA